MSGLTTELLTPDQDFTFVHQKPYALGLTNLAHRTTARSDQLSMAELERGVPALLDKIQAYYPKVVCFVGKQIAEVFLRVVRARYPVGPGRDRSVPADVPGFWHDKTNAPEPRDVGYGVLPLCIAHEHGTTLLFVTPSTSARVTTHQLAGKARIMSHLPRLLEAEAAGTSRTIPCLWWPPSLEAQFP